MIMNKIKKAIKQPDEIIPYICLLAYKMSARIRAFFLRVKIRSGQKIVRYTPGYGRGFNVLPETIGHFLAFTLIHELIREMRSFMKLAKGRKCLLDIGSLYGIFSLSFASSNPQGVSYAIEPSQMAFPTLKGHIKINKELKIQPFQIALGSKNGTIDMKYEWSHLVAVNDDENLADTVKVQMNTLDDFVKEKNILPDIIKIDTEGYEFYILEGGKTFLLTHDPVICLEIHIHRLRNYGISIDNLERLILSLGYKVYDLHHRIINNLVLYSRKRDNYQVVLMK